MSAPVVGGDQEMSADTFPRNISVGRGSGGDELRARLATVRDTHGKGFACPQAVLTEAALRRAASKAGLFAVNDCGVRANDPVSVSEDGLLCLIHFVRSWLFAADG